jgi:exosortase A-associated hydrolase 2
MDWNRVCMGTDGIAVLPRFLGEEGKRHFTIQFSTVDNPKAHIVFIPPFGEEMNRCRSLVATQSRAFARAGYSCTLLDFYGTGDSQGQLCDSSLHIWQENIQLTIDTLQQEVAAPLILWGLRSGGLIALNFASNTSSSVQDIILWQPVSSGALYITQMLRQRVASLMVRDLPPETTKEIRQRLEHGELVEIAGYTVGGELVRGIEAIDISGMTSLCTGNIYWLEHVIEAGKAIGRGSRRGVDQLIEAGNHVAVTTFCDPPIWLIHERDFAPELLAATDALLS